MNKKPFINAFLAEIYIVIVVLLINYASNGGEENIIIPIMMLSLFVLSAAVMGYLFLSDPIRFYLDGKKKEAVNFFLQTLATFAGITAVIFILWLILSIWRGSDLI